MDQATADRLGKIDQMRYVLILALERLEDAADVADHEGSYNAFMEEAVRHIQKADRVSRRPY